MAIAPSSSETPIIPGLFNSLEFAAFISPRRKQIPWRARRLLEDGMPRLPVVNLADRVFAWRGSPAPSPSSDSGQHRRGQEREGSGFRHGHRLVKGLE